MFDRFIFLPQPLSTIILRCSRGFRGPLISPSWCRERSSSRQAVPLMRKSTKSPVISSCYFYLLFFPVIISFYYYLLFFPSGNSTTVRRTAVREAGDSRHHGSPQLGTVYMRAALLLLLAIYIHYIYIYLYISCMHNMYVYLFRHIKNISSVTMYNLHL